MTGDHDTLDKPADQTVEQSTFVPLGCRDPETRLVAIVDENRLAGRLEVRVVSCG
jgi:hypothetical protein